MAAVKVVDNLVARCRVTSESRFSSNSRFETASRMAIPVGFGKLSDIRFSVCRASFRTS